MCHHQKVCKVVNILKWRKAYEHVAQITARLTGVRPPRVPVELEEQCRLMFIAVQTVFARKIAIIFFPIASTNFSNYLDTNVHFCIRGPWHLLGFDGGWDWPDPPSWPDARCVFSSSRPAAHAAEETRATRSRAGFRDPRLRGRCRPLRVQRWATGRAPCR